MFVSIVLLLGVFSGIGMPDREAADTLSASSVQSSVKQSMRLDRLASPSTSAFVREMEQRGLGSPKDLSSIVPNLHIPDYGSAMTSSVYLRGFGSRIDNPVLGLYIDDFPILDKNNYDFEWLDIRRADLLRGPQGTLYGRNAMTGVLSLKTLAPSDFQGIRASAEAGSGRTFAARLSRYHGRTGLTAGFRHVGGFYVNDFDHSYCDPSDAFSVRLRHGRAFSDRLEGDLTASVSWTRQGGWPYRLLDADGSLHPVDYNDPSAYRRLSVLAGGKLTWEGERWRVHGITSLQGLYDRMDLDQDFTRMSMFTLTQRQRQAAVTGEVILKPRRPKSLTGRAFGRGGTAASPTAKADRTVQWDSQTGVFLMARANALHAPVRFKEDGIRSLILDNANASMPAWLGRLSLDEETFPIDSDFLLTTGNAALYHESTLIAGRWLLTAGLRLDCELNTMDYDSRATVHYRLSEVMTASRAYETVYEGFRHTGHVRLLPKVSALYDAGSLKLFATVSQGYKSGGFNTQIFSDILRGEMMEGMMADMGVHLTDSEKISADNTVYKPETSLNCELGFRYAHGGLRAAASVFRIDCRNQQITVFPPGKTTGRMMSNAGRSASLGGEAEASYTRGGLTLSGAWGYARAAFLSYSDGNDDYSGKRIPYAPEHTLSLRAAWHSEVRLSRLRALTAGIGGSGVGRIWWDEANTLSQPFYMLADADLTLSFGTFDLYVRCMNLLDRTYDVFYFKSVGNSFFQRGKPRRAVVGIRLTL